MSAKKTVFHKVTWETVIAVEKEKSWWHKILGYTPIDHHVHILEGTVSANEGDSLDTMMRSIHNQAKMAIVNEEDPNFKSHNGIRYRKNVRDDLLLKKA